MWYVEVDQMPVYNDHVLLVMDPREICSDQYDGWWCTREKGHEAEHEAVGVEGISFALWGLDDADVVC